ncbi:MAG TPA: glycosyltransferase family 2 protein [Deltaproteobacteria bacterium]|jgi:glycosyltransferase involved in cell wall biosynthesis|nr:glycosyltransferase family 2 protein [Deltaproteobacteria bacterium]
MLSVVMAVKNEEDNMNRVLESIAGIASEIIIIDSGSTDRTLEISKKFNAKIYFNAWIDYPVQVQHGIDLATQDYILVLDADEQVSDELRTAIAEAMKKGGHDSYQVNRKTYYMGKYLDHVWHPEWRTRLFKKGACRYEGDLHETVVCSGTRGQLSGYLYHYSYRNLEDQLDRIRRYAKKSAEIMRNQGRPFRIINLIGNPIWAFLRVFIRKGALDGHRSYVVAVFEFMQTFLKYAFLLEMEMQKKKPDRDRDEPPAQRSA